MIDTLEISPQRCSAHGIGRERVDDWHIGDFPAAVSAHGIGRENVDGMGIQILWNEEKWWRTVSARSSLTGRQLLIG